jgi:CheY-like chemotaxis protein
MYADRTRFPFPDIFITDLRLGDESGLQFLEWMRGKKELKDLPVIVLSGKATAKDTAAAKNLGVSRIWNKPGDAVELQRMIRELGEELVSPSHCVESPRPRRAAQRH